MGIDWWGECKQIVNTQKYAQPKETFSEMKNREGFSFLSTVSCALVL